MELHQKVEKADGVEPLTFEVIRMINGGYVGRNQDHVRAHIEELAKLGVAAPANVPEYYPVVMQALTTGGEIQVVGDQTSGEVEFVLFCDKEGPRWVGVGSDHTDRALEAHSVLYSKQVCANVLSETLWPYEEVVGEWDELVLRSWAHEQGKRTLYQEGPLAALLRPEELVRQVKERFGADLTGLVIFSGSVSLKSGETIFGDAFEIELEDRRRNRRLHHHYAVRNML
jgi:hypothetical protein